MFFKPKYKTLTDEQLVHKMIKGHTAAFDELYSRYYPKMHIYFFRMLGQHTSVADDYTQDLFVKLIEKAVLFDPQKKFSTWFYTIASNMCKNSYRAQKSQLNVVLLEDWEQYLGVNEEVNNWSDRMEEQHFQRDLMHAIDALKPKHKAVYILRYNNGLSIREISAIEQIPEGTVKSRLHHALQQLAQELMTYHPSKK